MGFCLLPGRFSRGLGPHQGHRFPAGGSRQSARRLRACRRPSGDGRHAAQFDFHRTGPAVDARPDGHQRARARPAHAQRGRRSGHRRPAAVHPARRAYRRHCVLAWRCNFALWRHADTDLADRHRGPANRVRRPWTAFSRRFLRGLGKRGRSLRRLRRPIRRRSLRRPPRIIAQRRPRRRRQEPSPGNSRRSREKSSSAAGSRTAPMFCSSTAASRSRRCSGGESFLRCRRRRNLSRKRAARQPNGLWLSREVLTCSISAGRLCQRALKTRPRAHQRTPLREAGAFCSAPPLARERRRRPQRASWTSAHVKAAHLIALTFDHGLVAAGVAAAVGSASFAGFMIARDNSHPLFGGIEHLMIFAQPIGATGSHRRLLLEQASARPDDDATGSIASPSPRRAGAERATPRPQRRSRGQRSAGAAGQAGERICSAPHAEGRHCGGGSEGLLRCGPRGCAPGPGPHPLD